MSAGREEVTATARDATVRSPGSLLASSRPDLVGQAEADLHSAISHIKRVCVDATRKEREELRNTISEGIKSLEDLWESVYWTRHCQGCGRVSSEGDICWSCDDTTDWSPYSAA